jgi:hypothetical protein
MLILLNRQASDRRLPGLVNNTRFDHDRVHAGRRRGQNLARVDDVNPSAQTRASSMTPRCYGRRSWRAAGQMSSSISSRFWPTWSSSGRRHEMTATRQSQPLGHYGLWFQRWIEASRNPALVGGRIGPSDQYNDPFLRSLHNELVEVVAARIEATLEGNRELVGIVEDQPSEEQAIAAELGPVIDKLHELGLVDRVLSLAEQQLLGATSDGDRPAITALTELGAEIAQTIEAGLDPLQELGFQPTAYLPTEIVVIRRAAGLDLYQLNKAQNEAW